MIFKKLCMGMKFDKKTSYYSHQLEGQGLSNIHWSL